MPIHVGAGMLRSPAGIGTFSLPRGSPFMTALRLLMIVAFTEAVSWLGLLAGMIGKYGFDNARGVEIMGPVHGFLFMLFLVVLAVTHVQERWSIGKTLVALLESIPPFLGFWLAYRLRQELRQQEALTASTRA